VESGKLLRRFARPPSAVCSVVFSADGRHALAGEVDGGVRLWDVGTGTVVRSFAGSARPVGAVAFSPDSARALSGSSALRRGGAVLVLWNVSTGKPLCRFPGQTRPVQGTAFAPNGRDVLCIDSTGLRTWSATGVALTRRKLSALPVGRASFSSDRRRVLAADGSGGLRLWDTASGKELRRLPVAGGQWGGMWCVALSPDGRGALSAGSVFAMAGSPGHLIPWDLEAGKEKWRFAGLSAVIQDVTFSPDGRRALSAGADGMVRLWQLP
jgi:WD40 repeat protein